LRVRNPRERISNLRTIEGEASLAPTSVLGPRSTGTMLGRMSKVCAICGKKPGFGNNRSHSMVATRRRFNPNLQRVRVLLEGRPTRAYVCTRCLKAGKVQKAL
jgi:large subunit ribosomal protein L28